MEAKEFRTGNLLNYTTSEGDILPTSLDWQDLKWLEEDPEGFEPVNGYIPLTEEWLLKFGFEIVYDSVYRTRYDLSEDYRFGYDFNKLTNFVSKGCRFKGYYFNHILYVHQIQNLYFSLTGKELDYGRM